MDRLTKRKDCEVLLVSPKNQDGATTFQNVANKLCYFEDLQEQGKLIILPCNVGDIFYSFAHTNHKIFEWKVMDICISLDYDVVKDWYVVAETNYGYEFEFSFGEFGKTVFLTQAEAEVALKECEKE